MCLYLLQTKIMLTVRGQSTPFKCAFFLISPHFLNVSAYHNFLGIVSLPCLSPRTKVQESERNQKNSHKIMWLENVFFKKLLINNKNRLVEASVCLSLWANLFPDIALFDQNLAQSAARMTEQGLHEQAQIIKFILCLPSLTSM